MDASFLLSGIQTIITTSRCRARCMRLPTSSATSTYSSQKNALQPLPPMHTSYVRQNRSVFAPAEPDQFSCRACTCVHLRACVVSNAPATRSGEPQHHWPAGEGRPLIPARAAARASGDPQADGCNSEAPRPSADAEQQRRRRRAFRIRRTVALRAALLFPPPRARPRCAPPN